MVGPFEIIIVWYFLQNVLINWFKYILQYNSNILVNFFTLNWTLVGCSEVFWFLCEFDNHFNQIKCWNDCEVTLRTALKKKIIQWNGRCKKLHKRHVMCALVWVDKTATLIHTETCRLQIFNISIYKYFLYWT